MEKESQGNGARNEVQGGEFKDWKCGDTMELPKNNANAHSDKRNPSKVC